MSEIQLSVVCCDGSPQKLSRLVEVSISREELERRTIDTVSQEVAANEARELHNAAHHPEHGPVTYVQQVHEGGFAVLVGNPDSLTETFFGPGSFVAFMDDAGPGHASKVGPEGVKRTLRVLKGHLQV